MPLADLLRAPGGPRDRQLQMGERVELLSEHSGWTEVHRSRDGYRGLVRANALADLPSPSHRVAVRATYAYSTADFKARESMSLGFGAEGKVLGEGHKYFETTVGFIPKAHLRPVDQPFTDPVTVAQLYFGAPYLWGGNSVFGVDCSGLVQAGLWACGLACPGDSGEQENVLGSAIALNDVRRGDLIFWPCHVALVVDPETVLHANAHAMAVSYEQLCKALRRIEAIEGNPPSSIRRL